ncbi:MAG: TonB-dependent receptor [Steroidobacteraceae bacterium]
MKYLLGAWATCSCAAISVSVAQEAPGAGVAALDEVVVTAEKRAANVQSIASTVTAVSAEQLAEQGVKDITDLARVAPEVSVMTGAFQNIGIRGVRTGAYGPSTDSPNALHVDGVYMARFTGLNGFFFDTQRVEVLAGPQGTLYGRNSAGGTINIITNRPEFDAVSGRASVDYGNYNALTVNGALNVPVTDNFAVRLAFLHNAHSGYTDDTGMDDAQMDAARFSALWKLTDRDTLFFSADTSKIGGKSPGPATNIERVLKDPSICTNNTTQAVSFASPAGTCAAGSTFTQLAITRPDDPRHNRVLVGNNDALKTDTRNKGMQLQYDHDFDFATLTAQIGHRGTESFNPSGSFSGYQHDPRLFTAGLARYAAPGFLEAHSTWESQEVRLVSSASVPLQWQAGLYNFTEKSKDNHSGSYAVSYPNPAMGISPGALGTLYGQYSVILDANGNNVIASDIANMLNDVKARAVFGQATWTPGWLPALHVTGGARYNWEEKHAIIYTISPITRQPIPAANINQTKSWNKITYKGNIAFDIRPQNMIYVDHSTGFKSGGFAYGVAAAYEPEYLSAWEIGSKNRFLDNRLQVNVSAWDYSYRNQVTTIPQFYFDPELVPVNGTGIANTITSTNAGNSKVRGQSLDVLFALTDNDMLSFNVQHIKAKYTNYDLTSLYRRLNYFAWCTTSPDGSSVGGTCAGPVVNLLPGTSTTGDQSGVSVNYNGTMAGANPEWAGNAAYEHTFHFANAQWKGQVSYHYMGERVNGNQVAPNTTNSYLPLDSYQTFDLSLRYQPNGAKWSVLGYVRNVGDELYRVARGYTSNNSGVQYNPANQAAVLSQVNYAYTTAAYGPPRTFGVAVEASF